MSAPLALFRWSVPVEGVRVVADAEGIREAGAEWIRLGEALVPQGWGRREYDPLATGPEPLFEALARLPLESRAFAAFASRWGLLGLDRQLVTSPSGRQGRGRTALDRPVEPVSRWVEELGRLRDCFELWGAIGALAEARAARQRQRVTAAEAALGARIQVGDGFALLANPHSQVRERIGDPGSDTERLLRAHPRDLLLAGRLALRKTLDEELARHTKLRSIYDEGMEALRLRASPRSLLGAAWLQLAEAAAGGRKARVCPRCAAWFVVKSGRRGHDRYCASACRQAHQRLRTRARALAAEGRQARGIAAKLQQPLWLVREWLE